MVTIAVPATSANLGPGFDALGLALDLRDEVTVETAAQGVAVDIVGEGAGRLPTDGRNLVVRSIYAAFDALGVSRPGLVVRCVNRIPQARGLGSSAAAVVAGVLAARALAAKPDDRNEALALAAELEGHPDNVAPCLWGGLTVAWSDPVARAARMVPHPSVRPVLFVPQEEGLTAAARAALPATVPHEDAAFTVGRAALLVHALTAEPTLLFAATEDRLHQQYRAAGAPATAELLAILRARGVPAVVSGAGPSVLAFVLDHHDITDMPSQNFAVLPLEVAFDGARISHSRHAGR